VPPQAKPHANDPAGPGGKRLGVLSWGHYGRYLKRPVLRGLLFQFFCFAFAFTTFLTGFALFAERTFTWRGHPFGPREVGYLFAYTGVLGIILQGGLIGRLVKRFGEGALIVTGFGTLVVGYTALGLVHSVGALVLVATVASFGNGVLRPSLTSLVSQNAGRHEQGVVLGFTQSLNALALVLGPALGGFLLDRGMLSSWAWVSATFALGGLIGIRFGSALVPRAVVVQDDAAA
jgi:MFS transporter, DHA1 family, tetracycline resistance protein